MIPHSTIELAILKILHKSVCWNDVHSRFARGSQKRSNGFGNVSVEPEEELPVASFRSEKQLLLGFGCENVSGNHIILWSACPLSHKERFKNLTISQALPSISVSICIEFESTDKHDIDLQLFGKSAPGSWGTA